MGIYAIIIGTSLLTAVCTSYLTLRLVRKFYFSQKDQLLDDAAAKIGDAVEEAVLNSAKKASGNLENSVRNGIGLGVADLTQGASSVTGDAISSGLKSLESLGNILFKPGSSSKGDK